MKKLSVFLAALLISISFTSSIKGQYSVNIEVFPNLVKTDFAAFLFDESLTNKPRIFSVDIEPKNEEVILEVVFEWKENHNSEYQFLYSFTTKPFYNDRIIYSDEIDGSNIKIDDSQTGNDDVLEDLITKGKPTGVFNVTAFAKSVNHTEQALDETEIEFINPSSTLRLLEPIEDESYNELNLVVRWTDIGGTSRYRVLVNYLEDAQGNLEEALSLGTPVVDVYVDEDVNQINVYDQRQREIRENAEMVAQVIAEIDGISGVERIFSEPVRFYFGSSEETEITFQDDELETLLELSNEFGSDLFHDLVTGKINLDELSSIRLNDEHLSIAELKQILEELSQNPNLIINIEESE